MTPPRSPARQAIDAVLADGNWHTRDELLRAAAAKVPPGQAWRTGERQRIKGSNPGRRRTRGDDHTTVAAGAHRAAAGLLKSAVHRGAIEQGPDGRYRATTTHQETT